MKFVESAAVEPSHLTFNFLGRSSIGFLGRSEEFEPLGPIPLLYAISVPFLTNSAFLILKVKS